MLPFVKPGRFVIWLQFSQVGNKPSASAVIPAMMLLGPWVDWLNSSISSCLFSLGLVDLTRLQILEAMAMPYLFFISLVLLVHYLSSAYNVPATVLGTGDTTMIETEDICIILCIVREAVNKCLLLIPVMILPSPNYFDGFMNSEILGWNWPTKLESNMLWHSPARLVMGGALGCMWDIEVRQMQKAGRRNHTLKHILILASNGIFICYHPYLSQYILWVGKAKANDIPLLQLENQCPGTRFASGSLHSLGLMCPFLISQSPTLLIGYQTITWNMQRSWAKPPQWQALKSLVAIPPKDKWWKE